MTISSLNSPSVSPRHLPVDRYHTGVRLGAIGLWLVIIIGLYMIFSATLQLVMGNTVGGPVLIAVVAALFLSQPVARWAEAQLVQRWPSGRAVQLNSGALTLQDKSGLARFDLSGGKVNFWRWHFVVRNRRSGRVSNGDLMVGLRLVQGETVASLYAFVGKKNAEAWLARYPSFELHRSADPDKRPLGGREAVFFAAEQTRWEDGAELDPADLDAVLTHLATYLPDFKTNPSS